MSTDADQLALALTMRHATTVEERRDARNQLISSGYPMVKAEARRRAPRACMTPDLEQEGAIALLLAVDRYDPTRGKTFRRYALWHISNAMTRWLAANERPVSIPADIHVALGQARAHGATDPHQLAEQTGLPEAVVHQVHAFNYTADIASHEGARPVEPQSEPRRAGRVEQVARLIVAGMTRQQIAVELGISRHAVRQYMYRINQVLGASIQSVTNELLL